MLHISRQIHARCCPCIVCLPTYADPCLEFVYFIISIQLSMIDFKSIHRTVPPKLTMGTTQEVGEVIAYIACCHRSLSFFVGCSMENCQALTTFVCWAGESLGWLYFHCTAECQQVNELACTCLPSLVSPALWYYILRSWWNTASVPCLFALFLAHHGIHEWMITATLNWWHNSQVFLNQQSSARSPRW